MYTVVATSLPYFFILNNYIANFITRFRQPVNMRLVLVFPHITLLCACVACAPFGEPPILNKPVSSEQWENISHRPVAPISSTWWHSLNDATLNQLMNTALAQSPDLAIARARLQQAQAQRGLAQSQTGIQVGASINSAAIYHDTIHGGNTPPIIDNLVRNDALYGAANLRAQWTWDAWNKARAQIAAALGQERAVTYEIAQAQLILAQNIVQTYLHWQTLEEQKSIIQHRINIKQQQEKILSTRIHAGLTQASQLYPIQSAQQQLHAAMRTTTAQIAQIRHALSALSGQPANALDQTLPEKWQRTAVVPLNELTTDLLGKRPDIAAQREAIFARRHLINAARAEFYPNIKITALTGLSELKIGSIPTSSTLMANLLPSVSLPIFTAGALQANLAQKHAEFNEQIARYNQTVYRALREAADALSDYQNSEQAYVSQQKNIEIAQKAFFAARRRVDAGISEKMQQLNAQDEVLLTRIQALTPRLQQSIAWVNACVALGGGFVPNVSIHKVSPPVLP